MPDYFSPGVYIEEFESGPRPMSGVSTSIPGFLGLTAKGPVNGLPQLITSTAEFKRIYGSYLSIYEYNDFRFLPYAIDLFFANGGSACYVMRVGVPGASNASYIINKAAPTKDRSNIAAIECSDICATMKKTPIFLKNDTMNSSMLVYKQTKGLNVGTVKIDMSTTETDYKTVVGLEKFRVTTSKKNLLGHIFIIDNEDGDKKKGTDRAYCIVNSVEKIIANRTDISSVYSITEFYSEDEKTSFFDTDAAAEEKYNFTEIEMKVYIDDKPITNLYFAHFGEKDECIDDLENNNIINVHNEDSSVELELEFDSTLIDKLKNIDKNPMEIIFGEPVGEAEKKEIFPKGGKLPTFNPPVIPADGEIYYTCNEENEEIVEEVAISKIDSNIKNLTIDRDKTTDTKLFLSHTGKEDLCEELKESVLKFTGANNTFYYCIVESIDKEDSGYAVTLTNKKHTYTDIRPCLVEEYSLGISIGKNTPNKLNLYNMIQDTNCKIDIEKIKISLGIDKQMKKNLKDMKASPMQIISKNNNPSEKVIISEVGPTPKFENEVLPNAKGNIYYISNQEQSNPIKIVQIASKIEKLVIAHSTNDSELILSYIGDIQLEKELLGSILKFTDTESKSYYSIIKSISKGNPPNIYHVQLHKINYEYKALKFCTVEEISMGMKIGPSDKPIKLDFSKMINDSTHIIGSKDGISIAIDNNMRINLLDMPAAPLKIIKHSLDEVTEVTINKLHGSVEMTFTAKDVGAWGNEVSIIIGSSEIIKTKFCTSDGTEPANYFRVKSVEGFSVGDIVAYYKESNNIQNFGIIKQIKDNFIEFQPPSEEETSQQNSPMEGDVLISCKLVMTVIHKDTREIFDGLVLNEESPDFIDERLKKSNLITVKTTVKADVETTVKADVETTVKADVEATVNSLEKYKKKLCHPFTAISGLEFTIEKTMTIHLQNGDNGTIPKSSDEMITHFTGEVEDADTPEKRKGLNAFLDNDVISMVCIPGITNVSIQDAVVTHCEKLKSRIAILDIPVDDKSTTDIYKFKENIQSDYAAIYHPWLEIYDSLEKKKIFVPPSGAVVGIYARSDNQYGVHKAPANEIVRAITGLSCNYNKQEQDFLNPRGINLIRSFSGQGTKVWGARTCSINTLWKYVNVRRLFIYLEETIKANTNWIVFEPNNELLWLRVKRTIEVFLDTVWRTGALLGSSPEEAYYVDIGRSTMSQDDIDNGRLICVIGVAPVKPAEFVIFRLTQKTKED